MSDRPGQDSSDLDVPRTLTDPDAPGAGFPSHIGNYTIVREIGHGGMGRVFEAIQRAPRRTVALKVLSSAAVLATPAALSRFQRELQLLARLNHPNIAVIYEAGTFDLAGQTLPFFAMELVAGGESITRHARTNELPLSSRLRLLLQACDAVAHAHQHDIVHRDIKPSNLLVGRDGRVKLIDFGIARGGEHDADATAAHTRGDSVMGTLRYMSPEQLTGQAHLVDQRSDVYALGVVAYELLCERPPYDVSATDLASAIRQIADETAPPARPPSEVMAGLDASIDAVVMRAMSRGRAQRFDSAGEMAQAVRGLIETGTAPSLAVPIEPPSARPPVGRWVVRAAVAGIVAAASLLALALRNPGPLQVLGGGRFEGWAARVASTRAAAGDLPRNVTLLALTDRTDLSALETRLGVTGLSGTITEKWTLRALHGAAIPVLAASGARAIAFDIAFEGDRPTDEFLVRGVKAAREANVPVVGLMPRWDASSLSGALRSSGMIFGGGTAWVTPTGIWDQDVAVQHPGQPAALPSLALLAALSAQSPAATWELSIPDDGAALDLVQRSASGAVEGRRRVSVGQVAVQKQAAPNTGLREGTRVATSAVAMPDDAAFKAASIDYGELATLSAQELGDRIGGRIVLVTDLRGAAAGGERRLKHPGGRELPASYIQAAGLHAMLGGSWVGTTGWRVALAQAAICCALAAGLAIRWRHWGWRGAIAATGVAAGAAVVVSASLLSVWLVLLNPAPVVPATAAAAIGGAFIGRFWVR